MYALARNQITPMKYESSSDDWYPVPDNELPQKSSFTFKDVSAANNIGASQSPDTNFEDNDSTHYWQGKRIGCKTSQIFSVYKANENVPHKISKKINHKFSEEIINKTLKNISKLQYM